MNRTNKNNQAICSHQWVGIDDQIDKLLQTTTFKYAYDVNRI